MTAAETMTSLRASLLRVESTRGSLAAMFKVAKGGDAAATAMRDLITAQVQAMQSELTAAASHTAELLALVATPAEKPEPSKPAKK